ncbi:MAG: glycosyltransferase [Patescibacteria group bacterium]|jgi:glycosyltransferase involved in cell wall biosynthesis
MQSDVKKIKDELSKMRIALVHDYLVQDGGAERVLAAFQRIFPKAKTHVTVYNPKLSHPDFKDKTIVTSFLNNWPLAKSHYQWYLPILPIAVEHLDLSGYDLIISSSSSFAKGVIAPAGSKHFCYMHTPTRFLWEQRIGYLADLPQPKVIRNVLPWLLHRLRVWDKIAADRPDFLITNSETSRQRIKRHYNRDAGVIHPPVDVERIPMSRHPGEYWLAGGRLVAYKKFDLIVKAFSKLNMPLIVFGVGPELRKLKKMAGRKTKFVGAVNDADKVKLYRHAVGFINPQIEDFGITTIEAMAAGRPVIAFGQGGSAETVIAGKTGKFIDVQAWEDIGDAVIRYKLDDYKPEEIRRHAENFSFAVFEEKLLKSIARQLNLTTYSISEEALLGNVYAPYFD